MAVVGLVLLTIFRHKLLSSEKIEINLSTEKPPALRGPIVAAQDNLPTHVKEEYSIHKAIPVSNGQNSWPKDSLSQKLDSPALKESLGAGNEELSDPIDFKETQEAEINKESRNTILSSSPVIPEDKSESTLKDVPRKEDVVVAIEPSPHQTDPPIRTPQTIPDLSAEVKFTHQAEQGSANRSQATEHPPQRTETLVNTSHSIPLPPANELTQPVEPLPETLIDTQHIVPSPPEVTNIKQHSVDPQSEDAAHLRPINGDPSQSLHQLTETPLDTSLSNSLKTEPSKSIESLSQHTESPVNSSQLAVESTLVRTPVVTSAISLEKKESHEAIKQKTLSQEPQTKTLISGYSTGESCSIRLFFTTRQRFPNRFACGSQLRLVSLWILEDT